jgi:hypothetical protein
MKGCSEAWCVRFYNFVTGGSVAIQVNDNVVHTCKEVI